ncbi:hypothetical protein Taro_040778 [Colocasia esculenta]|uniref:Uncharacterized protein n=1 Tax=Colocasia esculenta TaxID=4460 RepID=A0A843WRE6_COLES|nr:hypothetical protein [Colocasia esculenta]
MKEYKGHVGPRGDECEKKRESGGGTSPNGRYDGVAGTDGMDEEEEEDVACLAPGYVNNGEDAGSEHYGRKPWIARSRGSPRVGGET